MRNYHMLFSFSFAAVSLALLGGGAYAVKDATDHIRKESPIKVNSVVVPTILPHPAPVDAAPPVLELPDTVAIGPTVQPKRHIPRTALAIAVPPKEKQMVCNGGWQDSNYGGQYRVCEMK